MAMSKPWVALNAQNRVIGRYVSEAAGLEANKDLMFVTMQYRPRKKRVTKEFPYV